MLCPVIQKIVFSKKAFVERRLGGEGKVFVKKGDRVRPFDFVAEVPPARGGSEAPRNQGSQRLTAGVSGEIVKLIPGKAVLVQTSAAIVRGVSGVGEDSEGEVRIAANHNEPLKLDAVDSGCAGDILVGGHVPTLEVFKKAEAVGVRGIVCGGADFAAFQKVTLPTLLTEGFGRPPLSRSVFEFLKSVKGRHVFLSPERGELLVARYSDGEEDHRQFLEAQPEEVAEPFAKLKKGMEVQVFTFSNFGQRGKAETVGEDVAEVLLENGDRIEVPERNIGIIR